MLVASTEQQNNLRSGNRVIDPVALSHVDSQFPNTVPAKFVIAEVAQFDAIDSTINGDSCPDVAEPRVPFLVNVVRILREVMVNLIHGLIIVYKRI